MRAKDNTLMRILKIIKNNGHITRTEIAKLSKLSKAMISHHIEDLLKKELIIEDKEFKKNKKLRITDKKYYTVGVVVYTDGLEVGLFNLNNDLISKRTVKIEYPKVFHEIDKTFYKAKQLIKDICIKNKIKDNSIIAMGFSFSVCIDNKNDKLFHSFLKIDLKELKENFIKEFNCPVYIENDTNLMALAEKYIGDGKDYDNFLYIGITPRGIGCGLILNGKLFSGGEGFAGEIGHTIVEENGKVCICGHKGCLCMYASIKAIIEEAVECAEKNKSKYLAEVINKNNNIVLDDIKNAILYDDLCSLNIIKKLGKYIGIAVSNLINILNLKLILIDNSLSIFNDLVLSSVKESINDYARPFSTKDLSVKFSSFNKNKNLIAIGFYTIHRILNDSVEFMNSIDKSKSN